MIILGVDPGTICTGFGIIKYERNEVVHLAGGTILLPAVKELSPRLEVIYNNLDSIIKKYQPDEFAIETAFYGKNVQSALKIGYARGVSLLAAIHNGVPAVEYAPREIKKAVVGKGSASKQQVQFMIKAILNLPDTKMKLDESDALAVAICHSLKINSLSSGNSKNWKSFIEANPERVISF